jgi:chaperone required for assembly of F1-ATPase
MTIPTHTPAKNRFALPTAALKDAIEKEWNCHPAFIAGSGKDKDRIPQQVRYDKNKMPLTAIAYTAIDKIAASKSDIVEVLMVYVDSDTLTYRATGSEELTKQQEEKWGAVLKWAAQRFDAAWATTSGVMPVEQSPLLHKAIERYLGSLNEWQLSAFCVLSSGFSSLVLAIAVFENHLTAAEAFALSRLEEEAQAEKWGRDAEVEARVRKMQEEIIAAEQFLRLLKLS